MRERAVKKRLFFRTCLNVNNYHFKTSKSSNKSIYANSMVSTNQNSTLDTQKLETKKHKYTTKKSSNHKGNNRRRRRRRKRTEMKYKKKKNRKTINKLVTSA